MKKFYILSIVVILLFANSFIITSCSASIPNDEQIKADLLGNQVSSGFQTWRFDALGEFDSFIVIDKQVQANVVEFDVTMRLRDLNSGNKYLLDALITYKKVNNKWELKSITPKLFRML